MKIIKTISITACVALLLGSLQVSASTVLRVGTWLPPSHPQNSIVLPTWGKWIDEATSGRVKLQLEFGMGHPKTMFDLVEDGVVDASWSFHGFVPGRFQATQIVELPLLGASAEAASVAHWRVHSKYLAKANEHDGLHLAALFTHGPGQIHLSKPITSLSDLTGKKIRIGGGVQAELGHRLGITPVAAPAPKVYELMQQGVVDGVFLPALEQKNMKLFEVAPNLVSLPGGMYLGSFSIFLSPDFLASISPEDKAAILSVSGEKLSALAGRIWADADAAGYEAAKNNGVNVIKVNQGDSMHLEFKKLAEGIDNGWITKAAERGIDAQAALNELRTIVKNYK